MRFLILVLYIATLTTILFDYIYILRKLSITLNKNHTIENMALRFFTLPGQIMDPETPGIYQNFYFRFSKCTLKLI